MHCYNQNKNTLVPFSNANYLKSEINIFCKAFITLLNIHLVNICDISSARLGGRNLMIDMDKN